MTATNKKTDEGETNGRIVVTDGGEATNGMKVVYEIEFTVPGSPEDKLLRRRQAEIVFELLKLAAHQPPASQVREPRAQ